MDLEPTVRELQRIRTFNNEGFMSLIDILQAIRKSALNQTGENMNQLHAKIVDQRDSNKTRNLTAELNRAMHECQTNIDRFVGREIAYVHFEDKRLTGIEMADSMTDIMNERIVFQRNITDTLLTRMDKLNARINTYYADAEKVMMEIEKML